MGGTFFEISKVGRDIFEISKDLEIFENVETIFKIKTNQAIVNVNCPWLFFRYVNPMAVGEGWNPLFWLFLNDFFTATTHNSEKISTFLETFLYGLPSWYNKAVKKLSSSFLKFESKFTQSLIVNYSLKTTFLWMLLKTIIVDHTKRFPKRCLTSLNDV